MSYRTPAPAPPAQDPPDAPPRPLVSHAPKRPRRAPPWETHDLMADTVRLPDGRVVGREAALAEWLGRG